MFKTIEAKFQNIILFSRLHFPQTETCLKLRTFLHIITFGIIASCYSPSHNILERYNILAQIRLTTSKKKLDILYSKLGIGVAGRLKT